MTGSLNELNTITDLSALNSKLQDAQVKLGKSGGRKFTFTGSTTEYSLQEISQKVKELAKRDAENPETLTYLHNIKKTYAEKLIGKDPREGISVGAKISRAFQNMIDPTGSKGLNKFIDSYTKDKILKDFSSIDSLINDGKVDESDKILKKIADIIEKIDPKKSGDVLDKLIQMHINENRKNHGPMHVDLKKIDQLLQKVNTNILERIFDNISDLSLRHLLEENRSSPTTSSSVNFFYYVSFTKAISTTKSFTKYFPISAFVNPENPNDTINLLKAVALKTKEKQPNISIAEAHAITIERLLTFSNCNAKDFDKFDSVLKLMDKKNIVALLEAKKKREDDKYLDLKKRHPGALSFKSPEDIYFDKKINEILSSK